MEVGADWQQQAGCRKASMKLHSRATADFQRRGREDDVCF